RSSTAARLSSTKSSNRTRSSGGYPVTASSGKQTRSAPASEARAVQDAIFEMLPSRSPTVVSICPRAIRITPASVARRGAWAVPAEAGRTLLGPADVQVVGLPDQVRPVLAVPDDLAEHALDAVPDLADAVVVGERRGRLHAFEPSELLADGGQDHRVLVAQAGDGAGQPGRRGQDLLVEPAGCLGGRDVA